MEFTKNLEAEDKAVFEAIALEKKPPAESGRADCFGKYCVSGGVGSARVDYDQ